MSALHLVTLSGLAVAWYGYHVHAALIFGGGLALVPAALVLRWAIIPSQQAAPVTPTAPTTLTAPAQGAEPAPLSKEEYMAIAAADVSARIKAARALRNAQSQRAA